MSISLGLSFMNNTEKVHDVQKRLLEQNIDGWLLYDFHRINDLAHDFLAIPADSMISRRFFYWIPAKGEPIKIVHVIEPHVLDHFPGEKLLYLKWETLEVQLAEVLKGAKCVAMEYSPRNALPYVSKVDGGVIDLVRASGVKVVSSAPFLQYYTCAWDDYQLETHLAAAEVLDKTVARAWEWIATALAKNSSITEYEVQQRILREFEQHGCTAAASPLCMVNAHSADPHYTATQQGAAQIKRGDFILIDLWCKKKEQRAVYADITRVGVADTAPTDRQKEIFALVRRAQKTATEFIQKSLEKGKIVKGFEVDQVCRKIIEEAGYGAFFTHRTGHNIHTHEHGPGANIDSLETWDDRPLIPCSCFSIEPGIYLPGEFGIRLEYDVYISKQNTIQITGGIQEALTTLL